jgi:hypothetical protein
VNVSPSITTQPQSQTVNRGDNATFTVVATGTAPLVYQWNFGGLPIAEATGSSFAVTNVQSTNAGNYSVEVINVAGQVTSSNAALVVNVPPDITTHPQGQTVKAGTNATFTVSATGEAPLSYQWRFNATDIPGATVSAFTVNNVQITNAGEYAVTVTNLAGAAYSSPAILTVLPLVPIEFTSITILGDKRVRLAGHGDEGTYMIEFATSITNWRELFSVPNTDGTFECIDGETNAVRRFYRARIAP